jgi:hypothetical protein
MLAMNNQQSTMKNPILISRRKSFVLCCKAAPYFLTGIIATSLFSSDSRQFNLFDLASEQTGKMIQESGDFLQEIDRLKQLAIPKESHLYQPPTAEELNQFKMLANAFIAFNYQEAIDRANLVGYELVQFFDLPTKQVFYGLRENKSQRGWGSYFLNPKYRVNALIEAPHILFDRFSEEIAARVFLLSTARGFLLAGAHRNANGLNTADVCNPINSAFQTVHQAWVDIDIKTWQIHGFDLSNQLKFPFDTAVVLSNGRGEVSPEIKNLSQVLRQAGLKPYVYNTLPPSSLPNQEVNGEVSGQIFSPLGGRQNVQGIYSALQQQAFIHVELDKQIRTKETERERVAKLIANSIS